MFSALRQRFFSGAAASGAQAKNRLQFVLVQDRAGLSNGEMASFKRELMDVIERYFIVNEDRFDVDYRRNGDTSTLFINSPVVVRSDRAAAEANSKRPASEHHRPRRRHKHRSQGVKS